jgi:hypothetical protein
MFKQYERLHFARLSCYSYYGPTCGSVHSATPSDRHRSGFHVGKFKQIQYQPLYLAARSTVKNGRE